MSFTYDPHQRYRGKGHLSPLQWEMLVKINTESECRRDSGHNKKYIKRRYTLQYLDIDKEGDFQWNINRANIVVCIHVLT